MTAYERQVQVWADGIQAKTVTADQVPPASRDDVQVELLKRASDRRAEAKRRLAAYQARRERLLRLTG